MALPPPGANSPQNPSLLERLRSWPALEPSTAETAGARGRWRSAVAARRSQGRPRRVLFIHGQLPGETGSGVYLQQIAAEAIRQGLDFHLISAGYAPLDATHFPGVPDERIGTCLFTPEGAEPLPGAVKTPISGMSVVMPYPVLAYRDRSDEALLDWLTAFGARISLQLARLQPDVIHVNHLWLLNGLARLIAPWIPLVASAHGTAHKLIVDTPRLKKWVAPCVASADHVCAISHESVHECVTMFAIAPERISIEGYGYEPELFNWRPVNAAAVMRENFGYDLPQAARLIVAVGKFADWKGFKALTMAVGLLRERGHDVTAVIVGEGDPASRSDLEAFIASKGLAAHVRLPGKVARTALPDIYRAADVYVLPSHVEPYGMVLMEAMACGAPSVAADTGGPPDFVPRPLIDAGLAVLVPPIALTAGGKASAAARAVYAEGLAAGISRLLKRETEEKARAIIADAMTHLSWARLVTRLAAIYERVSREAAGQPGANGSSATVRADTRPYP